MKSYELDGSMYRRTCGHPPWLFPRCLPWKRSIDHGEPLVAFISRTVFLERVGAPRAAPGARVAERGVIGFGGKPWRGRVHLESASEW